MSNPGPPPNPYGQPTPGTRYPQQADRGAFRQVAFGAGLVVIIAVVTNMLSMIGNSVFGLSGESLVGLIWSVFVAVVFAACAGLGALFISPLARAGSTVDLIRRLATAVTIGAAVLFVFNFIWAVIHGGQYLAQVIVSSGVLGSVSDAVSYGAFFALGVFVARALPASPSLNAEANAFAQAQGQAYAVPQDHAAPQGYAAAYADQSEPQGYAGPQTPGAGRGEPTAPPR